MSEQSYYFLPTYNLLTAIYSRYLWNKVPPCGRASERYAEGGKFLCAQK